MDKVLVLFGIIHMIDHNDGQSDFSRYDYFLMQQKIKLFKMKAFHNSSMTEEEYEILEKEIWEKYFDRHPSDDY